MTETVVNIGKAADDVVAMGKVALDFGRVRRITFHPDGQRPETDTDHTVMLALVACSLAERWFAGLNIGRVAQFCVVHDVHEVYADDMPTLRELTTEQRAMKMMLERDAARRLGVEFADLPWLTSMIALYESQSTPEARYVKFVDKVMPKITHLLNGGVTIARQGMTRDELVTRYERQGIELARYAEEFPLVEHLRRTLVLRVLDRIDAQEAVK